MFKLFAFFCLFSLAYSANENLLQNILKNPNSRLQQGNCQNALQQLQNLNGNLQINWEQLLSGNWYVRASYGNYLGQGQGEISQQTCSLIQLLQQGNQQQNQGNQQQRNRQQQQNQQQNQNINGQQQQSQLGQQQRNQQQNQNVNGQIQNQQGNQLQGQILLTYIQQLQRGSQLEIVNGQINPNQIQGSQLVAQWQNLQVPASIISTDNENYVVLYSCLQVGQNKLESALGLTRQLQGYESDAEILGTLSEAGLDLSDITIQLNNNCPRQWPPQL
ncbi:hypothetical protein O3M35_012225 [Rhynocoris fuscipes]|uniref:Uncharacterized protein n=1 Tax=Rhynocoris fuscipes TaxID=488301 RepID=A0AAW1CU69_9HEMI